MGNATRISFVVAAGIALLAGVLAASTSEAEDDRLRVVAWNDLGMHCMDSDYSVFSILPPFNTVYAQVIDLEGGLVTAGDGVTVQYEAAADPMGSINATSIGKTDFWDHAEALFGAKLPADMGLARNAMPGPGNSPQPMEFDDDLAAFVVEGVPITPYDDAGRANPYPLMRLVARGREGEAMATTETVLPVSDEMDCRLCHGSGSGDAAKPAAGWVGDPDQDRDYRLNVLLLHDELQAGHPSYSDALTALGLNSRGLYPTVIEDGRPVLCAACHASAALAAPGQPGVTALTRAVHAGHSAVVDPLTGGTLDEASNRAACYRCHPGSETRCLRGAMGQAVASDGSMAIQCQSCHGSMTAVGETGRQGWLDEPVCQSCHTGTAVDNNGEIRYRTTFEPSGEPRQAVNLTFATNENAPAEGLSLYRYSTGHGGVYCEACHGSTHAEFPTFSDNDNLQSERLQGHVGTLVECTVCHEESPETDAGGPHGLHPVGEEWVDEHRDAAKDGGARCQACHGPDDRGTVLSRSHADQVLDTEYGLKRVWRGYQIGCYMCHDGPDSEDTSPNRPARAEDDSLVTVTDRAATITLRASDPDGDVLELRIVSQPDSGSVALDGRAATYHPLPGFTGADRFTFTAWDGKTDSNLGAVTVRVIPPHGDPAGVWVPLGLNRFP